MSTSELTDPNKLQKLYYTIYEKAKLLSFPIFKVIKVQLHVVAG